MKVVIQRCRKASVVVKNELINKIERGFVILVGFCEDDNILDIDYMVKKILSLRIFSDENDLMNKNILDINGSILSISQFTLYAEVKKGARPSFTKAMNYNQASKMYEIFNTKLKEKVPTFTGIFGADMQVELINDGPVTIIIDSKKCI